MKLTAVTVAAIALCVLSLAARSHAVRLASEEASRSAVAGAVADNPGEQLALAAIDLHLRYKLHRLAVH